MGLLERDNGLLTGQADKHARGAKPSALHSGK